MPFNWIIGGPYIWEGDKLYNPDKFPVESHLLFAYGARRPRSRQYTIAAHIDVCVHGRDIDIQFIQTNDGFQGMGLAVDLLRCGVDRLLTGHQNIRRVKGLPVDRTARDFYERLDFRSLDKDDFVVMPLARFLETVQRRPLRLRDGFRLIPLPKGQGLGSST